VNRRKTNRRKTRPYSILMSGTESCPSNSWLGTLLTVKKTVALVVSIELSGLNFETSDVRCRSKIWFIPK